MLLGRFFDGRLEDGGLKDLEDWDSRDGLGELGCEIVYAWSEDDDITAN